MVNKEVLYYPKRAVAESVKKFPTPFFLYEEKKIRENCRKFQRAFGKRFKNFTPLYAVKANSNPHVLKIILDEGFGFDCSSPAEVWLAHKLGAFGMHTGNYPTKAELEQVLKSKKLLLNLDDISLLDTVKEIGVPEFLSFRINPGMTGATQKSLQFAGKQAKYGVPYEQVVEAYRKAQALGVKKFGIHMMTGSNVLTQEYFGLVTAKLLEIAGSVKKELGIDFEYINLGGGFGVPYRPEEKSLDLEAVAQSIRKVFDVACKKYNLREPKLMIEPGRMIMADAGWLITRVHVIKDGYKKFVGVDAGMNDLPRPSIYDAYHHISILNKDMGAKKETVNVVGRLCENNDQFAKDRLLPVIHIGDTVIIHNAGAHAYAMGHNYNGRPRSDEYLLTQKGKFQHIRSAETIKDIFHTILDF